MEYLIHTLQQGLSAILPLIILLGLLIFVHELGHFLVAKYFKVRVEVFSLGFGKKLVQYKRGDTTYCLSMIPLGGYVKMYGDDPSADIPAEQKAYSFTHKPVGQRIAVVLAGPLMNFFFAIFLFFVVALIGEEVRSPKVGDLETTSQAYTDGFRAGDTILEMNGKKIVHWNEVIDLLQESSDQSVSVVLNHENSQEPVTIQTVPHLKPNPNLLSTKRMVGEVEGLTPNSKSSFIGVMSPDSVAAQAGLKTGDHITDVGGQAIDTWRQLVAYLQTHAGTQVEFTIERFPNFDDKSENHKFTLTIPEGDAVKGLGIEPSDLYLARVVAGSPAELAGLHVGDRIQEINSMAINRWDDLLGTVKNFKSDQGPLKLKVQRGKENLLIEVTPKLTNQMAANGSEENRYTVGIMPFIVPARPETFSMKATQPIQALQRGWDRTLEVTSMTVLSFVRLLQAEISPKNIGGVISIGKAASDTFKIGISHFLQMMGIISINLFILNLLPIPVLDGGHLVFYIVESLKGSPMSLRKLEIAQQVGLVLLVSLMVFALFNDFSRIFGPW